MPKKKTLTKKKGPKGKKARAKAKLERQWGEEADEEEIKRAKYRKGKRRLNNQDSEARIKNKKLPRLSNSTNWGDDDDGGGGGDDAKLRDGGYHSDTSDSSEGSIENDIQNDGEQFALTSLLKKIDNGGTGQRSKSKKNLSYQFHNVGRDDNDDYDNDDDDDESTIEDGDESTNHTEEESEGDSDNENNSSSCHYLEPVGSNPFHSRFQKEPLTTKEIEQLQNSKNMKKVNKKSLNTNLVLQSSVKSFLNQGGSGSSNAMQDSLGEHAKQSFSHVHQILMKNWNKGNKKHIRRNVDGEEDTDKDNEHAKSKLFTSLQESIYGPISLYSDSQITCASRENLDSINNIVALHTLNHVLTANHHITVHNNKIRDLQNSEESTDVDYDEEDEWRDQGYTRPKVLILLPTRSTAWQFVQNMLKLLGNESSVENLERFNGEFGNLEEAPETDERRKKILKDKGSDWNDLFADHVNSDDDFKIGISLSNLKLKGKKNKKKKEKEENGVAMKLFSDFYHSDVIVASPMGLKVMVSGDADDDDNEADSDFLSSIEIVASLQSDVMLMQNWDHVVSLMDYINQQPKKSNHTDFSRVRNYFLEGQASHWRQLILVSRFSDPHLQSTFARHASSLAGQTKLRRKVTEDDASICNVTTKVRQVFQRVACESFVTQGDKRIRHFIKNVLPQLLETKQKHTLIYIPSYFDFVALRNILLKHDIANHHFVSITEYSRGSEVSRGRARFLQGRKRLMLYTGRAHFFMRHHIKGAKHLIMLGIPEHADFYPQLLNMLGWRPKVNEMEGEGEFDISAPASCLNLFTKYEIHSLERIVGTKHAERIVKNEKTTHLFTS